MRHRTAGRKLNKSSSHRLAMLRNMVTSLLEHERIVTTLPKAKELRKAAEKMITLGKRGDLHARRQAASYVRSKALVTKLFNDLAPQYADRQGGYTRIIRTGVRPGDTAPMALIELVNYEAPAPAAPKAQEQSSSEA